MKKISSQSHNKMVRPANFDFEVEYLLGARIRQADCLSRNSNNKAKSISLRDNIVFM